jgi:hypothetical protein
MRENAMTKPAPEIALGQQPAVSSAQPPYAPAAEPGPATGEPSPADKEATPEEMDVWWGAYSGWTMAPSWAVCILLTGLIVWGAWLLVPRGFMQGTILGLGGAVWLVQGVRWGYRVFGYNYRLTTRRLYVDHGFLYEGFAAVDLTAIDKVVVKRHGLDCLLGVGQVLVLTGDRTKPPLVLEGVRRPLLVAEKLREQAKAA